MVPPSLPSLANLTCVGVDFYHIEHSLDHICKALLNFMRGSSSLIVTGPRSTINCPDISGLGSNSSLIILPFPEFSDKSSFSIWEKLSPSEFIEKFGASLLSISLLLNILALVFPLLLLMVFYLWKLKSSFISILVGVITLLDLLCLWEDMFL